MKATDIKEIEAMTGAKVVAATKETSSFNSDFVLLDDSGTIRQAFTVRDINGKMCVDVFAAEYDTIAAALAYLNMTDEELAQNIEYINPDNTPLTMNANEIKAPEFSELSHAATNIVLAAENTCNIYQNHVEPLLRSLERKAAKGVTLSLDTLAKSSAMAVIIRESIKEVKRTSYDPFSANTDDRRAASLYLAAIYICDL